MRLATRLSVQISGEPGDEANSDVHTIIKLTLTSFFGVSVPWTGRASSDEQLLELSAQ